MSEPPYLGIKVKTLDVVLSDGSAFRASLHRKDGTSWAVGDQLELRFDDGTVWPATLTTSYAEWAKSDTEVSTLITAAPAKVELWYTGASVDWERWRRGRVEVQR